MVYLTISISLGRQHLLIHGSSGAYMRKITNQPLPGILDPVVFISSRRLGSEIEIAGSIVIELDAFD